MEENTSTNGHIANGVSETTYKITVKTGDVGKSGTDAKVFIQILGENGSSEDLELKESVTHKKKTFEIGYEDTFFFTMGSLGNLSRLQIRHDNTGNSAGWFLCYVQIVDESTRKIYLFNCNRWLARDEDDGQIFRELTLSSPDETTYKVIVKTSDIRGSGTDANVSIKMFGKIGSSHKLQLKHSATHKMDKFERNQEDIFTLTTASLGELSKVRIKHDNTGLGAAWHLEYVQIVDKATEKTYKFLCNRWLAENKDDGEIKRDLKCPSMSISSYSRTSADTVIVQGKFKHFPPDSYVCVTYYDGAKSLGKFKPDEEHKLNLQTTTTEIKAEATDELGNTAETSFILDQNIPVISYERIDWTPTSIIIKGVRLENFANNDSATIIYSCDGNTVLQTSGSTADHEIPGFNESWQGKITATATDSAKEFKAEREISILGKAQTETYHIYVTTSNVRGAGTDANVYIILYGENDDTGRKVFLKSSKPVEETFKRDNTDEFYIQSVKIGEIKMIKIGHDNAGRFPAWLLDRIEIEAPSLNKRLYFPCGRWIGKEGDDMMIERELLPVERQMEVYRIYVTTSELKGAGTDANVYITLFGENIDTGKHYLKSSKSTGEIFQEGQIDEFEIEAVKIGKIKKIQIGHDNTGSSPAWILHRIKIEAPSLRKRVHFPYVLMFDEKKADRLIEREIYPV